MKKKLPTVGGKSGAASSTAATQVSVSVILNRTTITVMAELSLNGGEPSPDADIPTGLNRIKTRPLPSSKDHHSSPKFVDSNNNNNNNNDQLYDSPISKPNQRPVGDGAVKLNDSSPSPREGLLKGKKIAQWFTSYLFKSSDEAINDIPSTIEAFEKEGPSSKLQKVVRHVTGKQTSLERTRSSQVPKGLKSFSHELGPRGGIRPVCTRAQSFNDLKELLGSLRSKFDTAKEVVNAELASFKSEVMEVLQKNDVLSLGGHKMAEELLILAQECIGMTTLEFRVKCETIVRDLTEKRQQCQTGLLKWLLTRMLFILTRCTRLLHFEKHSEQINEKSLQKFKKFLEQIPYFETSLLSPVVAEFDSVRAFNHKIDSKQELLGNTQAPNLPQTAWCKPEVAINKSHLNLGKDFLVSEKQSPSQNTETGVMLNTQQLSQDDNTLLDSVNKCNCGSLHEQEQSSDDSELVICRICEELVPTPHLESHSYICAYADKFDLKGLDVDERLSRLAEVLEQIIESRNLSAHTTIDSPEHSRMQITSSAVNSEGCSPKIIEWRNKGVEGMFEDIHEMDTACIEDAQLNNFVNIRSHSALKLNHCGPPSSTGSMTSASSTNTPRAGNFDLFWLEHNHPSEMEDVQQMTDLVDIAHCAACTDLSKEGSHEYLLDCMQDLQEVLQHSKLKALVIETFGRRIDDLLREKYMHACELVDSNSGQGDIRHSDAADNTSQSSNVSTPLHKDRTSIDDFEIIKPISRGAYGKVFLARKRATGDLFAIKVLKKLDLLRKNDIERIVAERNILITVRNPFVVRFFYSFTSRDHLYLVMEYLNGGDLFSLLRNVGCLDEDVARIYVAELVLALEYLHSRGIVHRDLKPDNILIAHDGHIKLTDFGLSKIGLMNSTSDLSGPETNEITSSDTRDQRNQHNLDRSHRSAVGTPDYLAPEILLGTEHGYAADWWSVGVILFEFITGLPPFTAEHPEMIFDNILNRKIPWPNVPGDMSYDAQDLIDRFLVHDPNQRLGADGSSQVKAHSFFKGVNWDTLASQKAAFVPQPDSVEDTSYFISRHNHSSSGMQDDDHDCSDSDSDTTDLHSSSGLEKMDVCGDLAEFESPPFDVSWMNFSFKNLSQLAAINHEVLLQSAKDSSKCSPTNKGSSP